MTKTFTVIDIDPGDTVLCDLCNKDWTNSEVPGGFLFGSYAVCPDFTPRMRETVKEYQEEHYIRAECPPDKSFAG